MDDNKKITSSINNVSFPGLLSIFPNPVIDKATIKFNNPGNDRYQYSIRDLTGKLVRFQDNLTGNTIELYRGNLKSGLYFIEVKAGKTYQGKIILL